MHINSHDNIVACTNNFFEKVISSVADPELELQ